MWAKSLYNKLQFEVIQIKTKSEKIRLRKHFSSAVHTPKLQKSGRQVKESI